MGGGLSAIGLFKQVQISVWIVTISTPFWCKKISNGAKIHDHNLQVREKINTLSKGIISMSILKIRFFVIMAKNILMEDIMDRRYITDETK
ncbi:hypothetical protein D3C71_1901960 [compost metagenome]